MTTLKKVLVAYDGSPQSKEALNWAIFFSRHTGASVDAVKVFEPILTQFMLDEAGFLPEAYNHYQALHDTDRQLMAAVQELGRKFEVEIAVDMLVGHVAEGLLEYVKEHDIDLICAGARGHGTWTQLLLGSVVRNLVHLTHVPVLVAKNCPSVDFTGGSLILATLRNVLVAYDGSSCSKKALQWAIKIAHPLCAQISVLKVRDSLKLAEAVRIAECGSPRRMTEELEELEKAESDILREAEEMGQREGVHISAQIVNGNVVEAILDFSQKHGVDLIVAGARGHGPLDMLPLGSVANHLISLSEVPVLVVKE